MREEIRQRIDQIRRGEVPEGYKRTKVGIVPEEWEEGFLGNYIQEYKELSNDIEKYPVYSSSRQGLIPQSQYYDNREAVETNLGYKIVPNGYVTYRHMSDDDVFHFNVNNTGGEILVSSEYPVFSSTEKSSLGYIIPMLNDTAHFRYFCRTQKMGGTRTRLYYKNLCTYKSVYPPLAEQEKIGEILQTQDKLIALKEKLIEEKKRQKKALMQQLLTGKKRLPGFSDEWRKIKLSAVLIEGNKVAVVDTSMYRKMTVKLAFKGLEFTKTDREMADTRPFYVRKKNEIIIGKQNYFNGSVALVTDEFDGCICSNAIMSFGVKNVNVKFILEYISQVNFMKKREMLANGTGQKELSEKEFLNFEIKLPCVEEQNYIGNIASTCDSEILLLQKDLDQEKQKKKALMQLLLTGIVRVEVNE